MTIEKISIREAARRLGLSDTAIRKGVKAGRVSAPTGDGVALLDWPKVRDEWLANSDTSKRSHVGSRGSSRRKDAPVVKLPTSDRMDEAPDLPDMVGDASEMDGAASTGPKSGRDANYAKARAAREFYAANLAKLEYEQKTGKLVGADEAVAAWQKHITAAKTRIMGIPASCKSRYADLPLAAIAIIEQVCREALEDLANG